MEALLAAILGFFMFPMLGFWLGLTLLSVIYTASVENDTYGFSVFATIVGILLFWKTIVLAFLSWKLLLLGVLGYFILGGIWSVFRWFKYCQKYIQNHPVSPKDLVDWNSKPISKIDYYKEKLIPSDHKSQLVGWIVYWPWSLLWNISGDFITSIYDMLTTIYQKVTMSVIKSLVK